MDERIRAYARVLAARETRDAVTGLRRIERDAEGLEGLRETLEQAMSGNAYAVRLYVRAYRRVTRDFVHAAHVSFPDVVHEEGGVWSLRDAAGEFRQAALTVLDQGAVEAPFSMWVSAFGLCDGVLLDVVQRVRCVLPAIEPLPLPAGRSVFPHWRADDATTLLFISRVRCALAAEQPMLETIASTFSLNDTELAALFGVRRQAIAQWRADGIPGARAEKASAVASLADLLSRKLKRERIPGIARRAARAYGGLTMLEMISADRHRDLLDSARASFDPSLAA